MKKKQLELLTYLYNQELPVTSAKLAKVLGISIRSIKNYILALNIIAKQKMITASNQGYLVHKNIAKKLLMEEKSKIPQTSEERIFYIAKLLLIDHTSLLDVYVLCESLYISHSTLKSDIIKMNKIFANFEVTFQCRKDTLSISGSEKNKRKLVSYILYEETNQNFMNINIIKEHFHGIAVETIEHIITSIFHKYHYYINDFAKLNLLLHFVIMLDRIKEGNFVNQQNEDFIIEDHNERSLVYELCDEFKHQFQITFTKSEQYEIYMLFKTNANYSLPTSQEALQKIVGHEIIEFAHNIVQKVKTNYYLQLGNENFLTPFVLHLKNLILRSQQGIYTKNPMSESIRTACPIVYDIAIYISIALMNHYNIHIHEDEITFLALHIGAEIERQKTNYEKLKCLLLCPDYLNVSSHLYNQLLLEFGNQIHIVKVISKEADLATVPFDICLSTIPLMDCLSHNIIAIPPFLKHEDKVQIHNGISNIYNQRKNWILKHKFHNFFLKELFITNQKMIDQNEILHVLTSKMLHLKVVKKTFEKNVKIREHAASTAFGNIAVPHAIKMDALQTCIGVYISKQGVRWGKQMVHIVFLIAVNKADNRDFQNLYEALIELFSKDSILQAAKDCTSFHEFKNLIFEHIALEMKSHTTHLFTNANLL